MKWYMPRLKITIPECGGNRIESVPKWVTPSRKHEVYMELFAAW